MNWHPEVGHNLASGEYRAPVSQSCFFTKQKQKAAHVEQIVKSFVLFGGVFVCLNLHMHSKAQGRRLVSKHNPLAEQSIWCPDVWIR